MKFREKKDPIHIKMNHPEYQKIPIDNEFSWYEQKAVIVLLSLLYLGVKNIRLGPTLPAFLSQNIAKVLIEKFGIAGIGTVDDDIKLLVE
jgi:hydroxylamine reductase